jgi:hypothetical protein
MTIYLRFEDEAEALACPGLGCGGELPSYIGSVAVYAIGQAFRPTGRTVDMDDVPAPEMKLAPGWHIMLSGSVAELAQYEIQPDYPLPVFAGSDLPSPATAVPQEVARWQAKLALMQRLNGEGVSLWDRLLQLRDALTESEQQTLLDAALHEVLNWRRASPTVEWAAQQLGLSGAQVDELFIAAAALEL